MSVATPYNDSNDSNGITNNLIIMEKNLQLLPGNEWAVQPRGIDDRERTVQLRTWKPGPAVYETFKGGIEREREREITIGKREK